MCTLCIRGQVKVHINHQVILIILSNWKINMSYDSILLQDWFFANSRKLKQLRCLIHTWMDTLTLINNLWETTSLLAFTMYLIPSTLISTLLITHSILDRFGWIKVWFEGYTHGVMGTSMGRTLDTCGFTCAIPYRYLWHTLPQSTIQSPLKMISSWLKLNFHQNHQLLHEVVSQG